MCTLMGLKNSNIVALIREKIALFDKFDAVYLFGSVLDENKFSNDVDMLIIYASYSDIIKQETNFILHSLENLIGLPIDLTVLSVAEEQDTHFLSRISQRYLRLK